MASHRKRSGLPHTGLGACLLTALALTLAVLGSHCPAIGQEEAAPAAEQAKEPQAAEPSEQPPTAEPEAKAPEGEPQPGTAEEKVATKAKAEAPSAAEKALAEKVAPEKESAAKPKPARAAVVTEEFDWRRAAIEAIVILLGALLATKAMNLAIRRLVAVPSEGVTVGAQRVRTLAGILISASRYAIFLVALLMILGSFRINIAPILAGVGFVGLAVGFGAQNAVRDMISGFFILFENSFSVGDLVRISGIEGTVEQMSLRSTSVRSYDGALHIIPNGAITMVSNFSKGYARAVIDVALPATIELEQANAALEEVAKQAELEVEGLLEVPQVLGIQALSRAEMSIRLAARVTPARREQAERELRRRIKEALERSGLAS